MRLLLIATVVIIAVTAARTVDYVAGRMPVVLGKIRWKAEDKTCAVTFRLRNQTMSIRKTTVFVTVYHLGDEQAPEASARRTLCGSAALRTDLKPLESRVVKLTLATTQRAGDCQVLIDEPRQ